MQYKCSWLLVAITICFVTELYAQRGHYQIKNGVGIFGGITRLHMVTDNFTTVQGTGFIGGMSATVDIPHKWYNVSFGMQIAKNSIGISARPTTSSSESIFLDYNLFAAQVAMLLNIKVIATYFTIDIGPMLQYNSNLEINDKRYQNYFINNYQNLIATDIRPISHFNFNGTIGASAGLKIVKLKAQYIYGFTNILKKLERQDLDTSGGEARFSGNQHMLVLGASVSF